MKKSDRRKRVAGSRVVFRVDVGPRAAWIGIQLVAAIRDVAAAIRGRK